jgi:amino acid transporter
MAAIAAVLNIFVSLQASFTHSLNDFFKTLVGQVGLSVPPQMTANFGQFLQDNVSSNGVNLSPPYSFLATLGIVPIAWTSLQWATYSVEQNTEIAQADSFRSQKKILIGSAVFVACLLWLVAHFEHFAVSLEFMRAASSAYWLQKASPEVVTVTKTVLQPFPNILAMAGSHSVFWASIIALGFVANAFQVTCNCFIGVTRILVAMGTDRLLPERLALDRVHPLRHAPVRAHWAYFIFTLPWLACYNFFPGWQNYTLGVTFACGYVFTFSALAATKIPSKMKSIWLTSAIYDRSPRVIRWTGYLGFSAGLAIVLAYLLLPQLGLTSSTAYLLVVGIVLVSYLLYVYARSKSPLLDERLQETPTEIEQFYREAGE